MAAPEQSGAENRLADQCARGKPRERQGDASEVAASARNGTEQSENSASVNGLCK